MPDVFEVLRADHEEVKQMLAELETGQGRSDGGAMAEARQQLASKLVIESSKHEAVEEMYFWPAVRDRVPGGDQLADTAIGQENEAKQVLARLDKAEAGDGEFESLIAEFIPSAREHISFEENQVWPGLRQALSAEEAEDLGDKIAGAKATAPTRPHPHTPGSPGVLKTAGPAVAAADRARDAMTGRGKED